MQTDKKEEMKKKDVDMIENLAVQINDMDTKLSEKYNGYPKTSVIYHRFDGDENIDWQLYFTIISNSNLEKDWENIKNLYMLKFNAVREYAFEISKMKSYTIGCKSKNIKLTFNTISSRQRKKESDGELKNPGDNIILWGIRCVNSKEESNLPDHLICILSQMEETLQKVYNIELIENLNMASR